MPVPLFLLCHIFYDFNRLQKGTTLTDAKGWCHKNTRSNENCADKILILQEIAASGKKCG